MADHVGHHMYVHNYKLYNDMRSVRILMVIFTMMEETTLCNAYNIIQGTTVPCDTLSINVSV